MSVVTFVKRPCPFATLSLCDSSGDPRFFRTCVDDVKIASHCDFVGFVDAVTDQWKYNLFARFDQATLIKTDSCDPQRRAPTHHICVRSVLACVDAEQPVAVRQPMLLRRRHFNRRAVLPGPAAGPSAGPLRFPVQTIVADTDVQQLTVALSSSLRHGIGSRPSASIGFGSLQVLPGSVDFDQWTCPT